MAKIFLNGVVGTWFNSQTVADLLDNTSDDEITVFINSVGGSAREGFAIYNLLKASKKKVTTVNVGLVASAATLIFLAGDERVAMTGSQFMIHKPSAVNIGDADDFRKKAEVLDVVQQSAKDIYEKETNISNVDEEMNKEKWYRTAEMEELGITNSNRVVAFETGGEQEEKRKEEENDMATIEELKAQHAETKAKFETMQAEKAEAEEKAKLEKEIADMQLALTEESKAEVKKDEDVKKIDEVEKAKLEAGKDVVPEFMKYMVGGEV